MPNQLVLHIQPEEGISLQFAAKVPGPVMRLGTVDMNFEYQQYFGKQPSTGYERLLHDCMIGDQTLFQRADMVEAGWSVVNPVLDLWKALPPRNFPNYASGTWGPKDADELLERDGRRYACQLTAKGAQVALLFLFFHKRLCGPLAHSRFHHQADSASRPDSKLEAAYHKADKAIDNIVALLAAA